MSAAPPLSISIDGREFQTAGDSAGTPKAGGYDNEMASNGNPATARVIKTPTTWGLPDQVLVVETIDDWEYLKSKRASDALDIVAEYPDEILGGTGAMVGELAWDKMASTASVSFAGAGEFEPQ
jgi:hypothetical protein